MQIGIRWWVVISGGLMAIGGFGPWATVFAISVDGTNGDGWIVLGAAAFGAGLSYAMRGSRWAGAWALVGGVVGLATTAYDRNHLETAISKGGSFAQAMAHVGWGLNLALIASISMALAGLVGLMQGPPQAVAPAPASEAVPASPMAGPSTAPTEPPSSSPE